MFNVLIVDDEQDIRELIAGILEDEGYQTQCVASASECMGVLEKELPNLLLLDIWLKDSNLDGIDILKHVKNNYPEIPVVIISGHGTIEIAVAAIKQGAYDFIEKPFNIDQLLVIVTRAQEAANLRQEVLIRKRPVSDDFVITGNSSAARTLRTTIEKLANKKSRVLLCGENGVGKHRIAQFIHAYSDRARAPFYRINSAENDLKALLCGYAKKENGWPCGLLQTADGGILYFSEISELTTDLQEFLLHFLLNGSFTPIGGQNAISTDIRILSATQKDLENEVAKGNFRRDLYDRLSIVTLDVPNLKARTNDIPELAKYALKEISARTNLPCRPLSNKALIRLEAAEWPGNIHQLQNLLERALILGTADPTTPISASELLQTKRATDDPPKNESSGDMASILEMPLREARENFERNYLLDQINRFGGNISRTSNFVGMERSALHRKLKLLNIKTPNKAKP